MPSVNTMIEVYSIGYSKESKDALFSFSLHSLQVQDWKIAFNCSTQSNAVRRLLAVASTGEQMTGRKTPA